MKFISLIIFSITASLMFAQAPKFIPFQAIAKSTDGFVFSNQAIQANFKLRRNASNGDIVFEENQNVTTSSVGTFSAEVGRGQYVQGNINALATSNFNYFLEVNLTINGQIFSLGAKKLDHVPYCKYANGERFRISETGDTLFKGGNVGIIIPGISAAN